MTINFENPKHEALANDHAKLSKWATKKTTASGDQILTTLNVLEAAPSLYDIPSIPWHPHPLEGKYKGCFAVWIKSKYVLTTISVKEANHGVSTQQSTASGLSHSTGHRLCRHHAKKSS